MAKSKQSDPERKYKAISTLWNLLGRPTFTSEGELRYTGPENIQVPIGGEKTEYGMPRYTLGVERGLGLFEQWKRPDWRPNPNKKDIKFILSRYF